MLAANGTLFASGDRFAYAQGLSVRILRDGKLDPTIPQAHANLCNVLREEGDLDLAIAHGRKAVELDPHLHQGHAGLALALDQAGRIDEAMQEYRAALRLLPQDDWTWANLGSVYLRRDGPGDTEEAASEPEE